MSQYAACQILDLFARHKIPVGGVLRRNHFFDVRDGEFLSGMKLAIEYGWVEQHLRDRYRYVLTKRGREQIAITAQPTTATLIPTTPSHSAFAHET